MAAENQHPLDIRGSHRRLASMRPRRMAAENRGVLQDLRTPAMASMRPRRMAAENLAVQVVLVLLRVASMRPRRMAAENRHHPRRPEAELRRLQ